MGRRDPGPALSEILSRRLKISLALIASLCSPLFAMRCPLPTVTFTAGCAGSGKSTILAHHNSEGLSVVDPDKVKESLPGYDPENPGLVHAESSRLAMREFYRHLGAGRSFFMDGTCRNLEKTLGLVNAAHGAGFRVQILWVRAPLAVCLLRNARRPRKVGAEAICEAFEAVEASMEVLKPYVDSFTVVDNP